ncbi:translocating chain-associated membrane protein 1-like [Sycon ciliatum]|uniref:translocating chain-associated membrane protein 1-like n=1 Tax=Sycon ciliatum TaxID=27933 RepID=UPI0020ABA0F8|eukprot:scpid72631/ scgid35563/ Translocating chain-associated membrane protein 1-like 1
MARDIKIPVAAVSRPGKKKKNVPVLSHEFIQDNHADIISVICMLMVFGLMVEVTRNVFTPFVAPQHLVNDTLSGNDSNATNYTGPLAGDEYEEEQELFIAGPNNTQAPPSVRRFKVPHYATGPLDFLTLSFYTMVWVVVHAVFKEYLWDRFHKPLRLSKAKTSVYYESFNLVTYYLIAVVWAFYVAGKERLLTDVELYWRDYPHLNMTFRMKVFLLIQIGYWLHNIPELYFMKAKRDEISAQIQVYIFNVIPLIIMYCLHFQRIGTVLFAFHATAELLSHLHTLLGLWRPAVADKLVPFWTLIFSVVRIFSVALAVMVFGVGMAREKEMDLTRGNYNTLTVRMMMVTGIILLQLLLAWQFVTARLSAIREHRERKEIQSKLERPSERRQRQQKEKRDAAAATADENDTAEGADVAAADTPKDVPSPSKKETSTRRRAAADGKSKH